MRKITNISITDAELTGFRVELKEDKPEVSATIALKTAGGKQITEYTIATDAWDDNQKMELPTTVINPILKIAEILEQVVAEHCENTTKQLNQMND